VWVERFKFLSEHRERQVWSP